MPSGGSSGEEGTWQVVEGRRRRRRARAEMTESASKEDGDSGVPPEIRSGRSRKIYGKPGNMKCLICGCLRDHSARDCPGNVCHKCGDKGHWVASCPKKVCTWCAKTGGDHDTADCPYGGKDFIATKRARVEEETPAPPSKSARVPGKRTIVGEVSSFLDTVKSTEFLSASVFDSRMEVLADRQQEMERRHARERMELEREREALKVEYEGGEAMREAIQQLELARANFISKRSKISTGTSAGPVVAPPRSVASTSMVGMEASGGEGESVTPVESSIQVNQSSSERVSVGMEVKSEGAESQIVAFHGPLYSEVARNTSLGLSGTRTTESPKGDSTPAAETPGRRSPDPEVD